MNHIDIFSRSINDFFSKKFLLLSFAPLLIALAVLFCLMLLGASEVLDILQEATADGAAGLEEDYPILAKILSFAVVHYILAVLVYFLGTFLVVTFGVVIGVLALGFLTPTVVKTLHEKYYSQYELRPVSTPKTLKITLFIILKFLLLLLLSIPLMLVPIINTFVFSAVLFYLFYKLLVFDAASNIVGEKEIAELVERIRPKLIFICFIFYLMALRPIAGQFLQLYFAIYLTHYFFITLIKK
ncbi:MAG: EI24 domain-containing protein [Campylobacteraceae bacterium]|jgi:uncharacterized membrane protein|nr:EI24 domain-containing protein [Campylobacteraceae bacterium]